MNPQKNQGAADSPLLRDLQSEVSAESAPLLQFMIRHAGLIAGIVVLFVLVLGGVGVWRWHSAGKNDEAREALARILQQQSGAEQIKALADLAQKAPADVRFAVHMALGQSALSNNDPLAAAGAYAAAAKLDQGALGLAAAMDEAGALLKGGKSAEALALLQKLQGLLPGEVHAPQLRQMLAEAAVAAGQPEQAARAYLALAREVQGLNSDYFRARAAQLAPKLAEEDAAAPAAKATPTAPEAGR